jgi:hypothetical protein
VSRIWLDVHGNECLEEWLTHGPSSTDVRLVLELVDDFSWKRWHGRWHADKDRDTGDLIFRPREGLIVVVRPFEPDDEGESFSIIWIGEDTGRLGSLAAAPFPRSGDQLVSGRQWRLSI